MVDPKSPKASGLEDDGPTSPLGIPKAKLERVLSPVKSPSMKVGSPEIKAGGGCTCGYSHTLCAGISARCLGRISSLPARKHTTATAQMPDASITDVIGTLGDNTIEASDQPPRYPLASPLAPRTKQLVGPPQKPKEGGWWKHVDSNMLNEPEQPVDDTWKHGAVPVSADQYQSIFKEEGRHPLPEADK